MFEVNTAGARATFGLTPFRLAAATLCAALAACGGGAGAGASNTTATVQPTPAPTAGATGAQATTTTGSSGTTVANGGTGSSGTTGASTGAAAASTPTPATSSGAASAAAPAASTASTPSPATGSGTSTTPVATSPVIGACAMFPPTAIFNTRIDDTVKFPAHASSTAWKTTIGNRSMHPDWGNVEDTTRTDYYGIPYNVVDGTATTTAWPIISFDIVDPRDGNGAGVPDESDCAAVQADGSFKVQQNCSILAAPQRRFPFPPNLLVKMEGGSNTANQFTTDSHVLVLEKGRCRLWESYYTYQIGGQWHAYSTAAWDLSSLALRPDTWGSGDAAGLPILPLLVRADEASSGEIKHALRVTFKGDFMASLHAPNGHVWPARHAAGKLATGGIPFGALMRLRSDFVIPATWTTQAKAIATAMKQYGLYIADNGSNFFVQGEPSVNWNPSTIPQLSAITVNNLEFVDTSSITKNAKFNANSMAASW